MTRFLWTVLLLLLHVLLSAIARAETVVDERQYGYLLFGRDKGTYDTFLNELNKDAKALLVDPNDPMASLAELNNTNVVVISHGMSQESGVLAQRFSAEVHSLNDGISVDRLILINGFLQRTWRPAVRACVALAETYRPKRSLKYPLGYLEDGSHDCHQFNRSEYVVDYPVPTLSIGGTLDGVVRMSRLAESFHVQRNDSALPVVVVEGLRHASIVDDIEEYVTIGDLPADLPGALTANESVTRIVNIVVAYASQGDVNDKDTETILAPLVEAFVRMEGSWFFRSQVDEEHGSSTWAADAQRTMLDPLPQWFVETTANEFRLLSDEDKIPPYYREKHRASLRVLSQSNRTFASSTVAQLRYVTVSVTEAGIGLNGYAIIKEELSAVLSEVVDDGRDYVSAIEIATKMVSRQLAFNLTGEADPSDALDAGDRCATINKAAVEWALGAVNEASRARYASHGVPLRMIADRKPTPPAGPWWIWNYLSFAYNDTSETIDVSSWYAFYSLSGPAYGAGNHYCKLLSPARAMEWILIDSLRGTGR
eukprot:g1158.t1